MTAIEWVRRHADRLRAAGDWYLSPRGHLRCRIRHQVETWWVVVQACPVTAMLSPPANAGSTCRTPAASVGLTDETMRQVVRAADSEEDSPVRRALLAAVEGDGLPRRPLDAQ